MMNEERRGVLKALCREMIQTYSVTGNEQAIGALLCRRMKELGFDEAATDELGNVVGRVKGTGGGKTLLLDGHIDTVEVADESRWSHPPFAAQEADGRLYGRGAADMKGALAAMICAAAFLARDARCAGDVYVTGTTMEEIAEGTALKHILGKVKADLVIIGEATQLNLNIGQRGRGEILLVTRGKSAHSSNPEIGVNAVKKMMKLLERVHALPIAHSDELGDGILELTDIISSPYPGASVVPELCTVTMDRRLLVGEDEAVVLGAIRAEIEKLKREDPDFDAEVSIAGMELAFYTGAKLPHKKFAPAWHLDKAAEKKLIDDSLSALGAAGLEPEVSAYKFCTNGSASAGQLGIPTIGFGPCAEWQAHVVDEYIELDQLEKAAEGYYALIKKLAGG